MDNLEKHWLRQYVQSEIGLGHDMKTAVKRIKEFGFKPATIKKYYKAFSN